MAIGSGKEIQVKNGDKVIHDKYAGTTINIDDTEHIIIKAEDVLAIIE